MSTLQVSLELGERHSRPLFAGQLRDQQNVVLALLLKNARISAYPEMEPARDGGDAVLPGRDNAYCQDREWSAAPSGTGGRTCGADGTRSATPAAWASTTSSLGVSGSSPTDCPPSEDGRTPRCRKIGGGGVLSLGRAGATCDRSTGQNEESVSWHALAGLIFSYGIRSHWLHPASGGSSRRAVASSAAARLGPSCRCS